MSAPLLREDWRKQLEALADGWDSYHGKPISPAALDALGSFAVVPCSSGGLQLEVHRDGLDIEIEIDRDGRLDGVYVGRGGREATGGER